MGRVETLLKTSTRGYFLKHVPRLYDAAAASAFFAPRSSNTSLHVEAVEAVCFLLITQKPELERSYVKPDYDVTKAKTNFIVSKKKQNKSRREDMDECAKPGRV